jgi:hypothetical protein
MNETLFGIIPRKDQRFRRLTKSRPAVELLERRIAKPDDLRDVAVKAFADAQELQKLFFPPLVLIGLKALHGIADKNFKARAIL